MMAEAHGVLTAISEGASYLLFLFGALVGGYHHVSSIAKRTGLVGH